MADTNTAPVKWPAPQRYCSCGGPEDTGKPPIKRATGLNAVPLKLRDPDRWFLTALDRGHGDGDGWLQ